ncbi:MAG TPA: TlpA disulfide reductase family protein, partial [Bryobacteraceae bacterium]|nr:TlpA disulfide reductase family protein [Bryobacteraceae bacterium]
MSWLLALLAAVQLMPVDEASFPKLIAARQGQIVLVDFWATWCAPCREELPQLAALEKKWRDRGLVLLTVSADEPEQASEAVEFLQKCGIRFPAWRKNAKSDEDFINSIDRKWSGALPALFLYDRQGRKVRSFIGETTVAEIEAALQEV